MLRGRPRLRPGRPWHPPGSERPGPPAGGERLPGEALKGQGSKDIEWVGARIRCLDKHQAVVVTLPKAKIQALLAETDKFLGRLVVGARELILHCSPLLRGGPHPTLEALSHQEDRTGSSKALLGGRQPRDCHQRLPMGAGSNQEGERQAHSLLLHPPPDTVLEKFKAERGLPRYNTLWEGLALLAAFRLWATFRAKWASSWHSPRGTPSRPSSTFWLESSLWTKRPERTR